MIILLSEYFIQGILLIGAKLSSDLCTKYCPFRWFVHVCKANMQHRLMNSNYSFLPMQLHQTQQETVECTRWRSSTVAIDPAIGRFDKSRYIKKWCDTDENINQICSSLCNIYSFMHLWLWNCKVVCLSFIYNNVMFSAVHLYVSIE